MTNKYVYEGGDSPTTKSLSEPFPEDDYRFIVLDFNEPYLKDNGRWVCRVKIEILKDGKPSGKWVWAHPWSGETNAGKKRDGIGQFLQAINCAPKKGQAPEWDNVIGTNGRCHLRIKTDDYGTDNEVAYWITPRPMDLAPENRMTTSRAEYEKNMPKFDNDEPDDIDL